jgi:hypothetical protein
VAQGTITRLTYERLGILLTDAPAYKENGSKYTDLIRVQGMDYSFSHVASDIKSVGSDSLVTKNGQSPILRAPDVDCGITYLFAEGQNEIAAGLYIGRDASILKNKLSSAATDDINIIVVASDKDEHKDLMLLGNESDFENYNVIGIGNAFLTSYTYNASVGNLPMASFNYAGSNMKFDLYSVNQKPKLPAVKLGVDNLSSEEELYLHKSQMRDISHDREDEGYVFDEHHIPEISCTKPGDIKVTMTKKSGGRGGARLDSVHAAVQSISINLPIPRQDIYGMGSNYVFNRKLQLPVIGNLSIDMVLRGYDQDQVDSFLTKTDVYELLVEHPVEKRILGLEGSKYIDDGYYYIAVEENDWRRVAMTNETRSSSGLLGDTEISSDGNFYYVCLGGNLWGSISLAPSEKSFSGHVINDEVYDYRFVYVSTLFGWKKFPVTSLNFDIINLDSSFDVANKIAFQVDRAQLKQQSYSHSIGSDVMVSTSMTFDVSKIDGLRIFFK